MDSSFWIERWSKHEIGFHQGTTNEYLVQYWPQLGLPPDSGVFVPLCGKSLDMRWLQTRGHRVLGVEIARSACAEFYDEWGVTPEIRQRGPFEHWSARDVTILCGDFFDLTPKDVSDVHGVFDRAALIALPPAMRERYVQKLRDILAPNTQILLVAPDYDQHQMNGPPFAVSPRELHALFAGCKIDELAANDVTDAPDNARFRQRGLTSLIERVFRIHSSPSK